MIIDLLLNTSKHIAKVGKSCTNLLQFSTHATLFQDGEVFTVTPRVQLEGGDLSVGSGVTVTMEGSVIMSPVTK